MAIDPQEFAKMLGADIVGEVPDVGGGPFGMAQTGVPFGEIKAVRDWLVQWGIAAKRVEARGFGGTKPLAQPGQPGAAMMNDRIELIILERK